MEPGHDEPDWRRLVVGERVARLATTRSSGAVDLVPITFAFVGDELVFAVDHKPKSSARLQRLRNIEHRPEVTVLWDLYDDADWSRLWWVRMRGVAAEVSDQRRASEAVDALVATYPQYRQQRPVGPVVRIEPVEWRGWISR